MKISIAAIVVECAGSTKEPLNNSAQSAFQSEKPQIVRGNPSDSSRSYGLGLQRARCGFSVETHTGRAFARAPTRLGALIWNDQTTLTQAKPEPHAKVASRLCRVIQRFPNTDWHECEYQISTGGPCGCNIFSAGAGSLLDVSGTPGMNGFAAGNCIQRFFQDENGEQ
ncbi:MAG: hypothetical protein Tsb0027_01750 [Wenzhouxiangellaceae bacterium]